MIVFSANENLVWVYFQLIVPCRYSVRFSPKIPNRTDYWIDSVFSSVRSTSDLEQGFGYKSMFSYLLKIDLADRSLIGLQKVKKYFIIVITNIGYFSELSCRYLLVALETWWATNVWNPIVTIIIFIDTRSHQSIIL